MDGDAGVEVTHKVTGACRLRGTQDDPIFAFEYTLRTILGPDVGEQSVSAILPGANLGIPTAGAYEIAISVDDEPIGSIPFTATLDETMFAEFDEAAV